MTMITAKGYLNKNLAPEYSQYKHARPVVFKTVSDHLWRYAEKDIFCKQ
jgi:hypothetical protein